jgi:hypothetical protein
MPSAAGALGVLAPTIPSAAKQAATRLMCFISAYPLIVKLGVRRDAGRPRPY